MLKCWLHLLRRSRTMWSMKQRVFWHMQWQDYGVWILLQRNQVITQKEMRIYTFISSISSIFCVWCFFDATSAVTRILWAKISIFETAHEMAVGIFLGLNINHESLGMSGEDTFWNHRYENSYILMLDCMLMTRRVCAIVRK